MNEIVFHMILHQPKPFLIFKHYSNSLRDGKIILLILLDIAVIQKLPQHINLRIGLSSLDGQLFKHNLSQNTFHDRCKGHHAETIKHYVSMGPDGSMS